MAGKPRKGKYDDSVSAFIEGFWRKEFHAPTIREIMGACGLSSSQVAYHVVHKIAKSNGYVFLGEKGSARSVTPGWVIEAIKTAASAMDGKPA